MIKRLTSLQNETVKQAASLQQKKYRLREGLFLVEGVRAVREVRSSSWTVTAYFFTDLPEDFQKEAQGSDIPYYEVTGDIMKKLTATEEPQSLAALVRLKERSLETVHPERGLILVLDEIHDPGNVGTMIRTARAMNAQGVILLSGSADLYNPKVVRAAMGNLFHIPVFTGITEDALMTFAQKAGWTLVATALDGAADGISPIPKRRCSSWAVKLKGFLTVSWKKVPPASRFPCWGKRKALTSALLQASCSMKPWCSRIRDGTDFLLSQMIDVPRP